MSEMKALEPPILLGRSKPSFRTRRIADTGPCWIDDCSLRAAITPAGRLCCAAASKLLSQFFERWFAPDEPTP